MGSGKATTSTELGWDLWPHTVVWRGHAGAVTTEDLQSLTPGRNWEGPESARAWASAEERWAAGGRRPAAICILGLVGDHFISQGMREDQLAPRQTLYSLNCMEWSLLPPATEEMEVRTSVVKGRFMGDPSHEYEHTELQETNEGEKLLEEVVVQIKEETRLVSIIDQIDKAVAIIPRGALFRTPFGPTHVNRVFEGLSLSEAKKLSSYFHFREPVELKNKTLLEKADLDPSLDFMDSLEHDIPKGSWSIQMERGNALVVLRSLLWPGLTFYHAPRTKNYGSIYVGTGEKNMDLPFML
ncbi:radial spoke head protein 9 homolog [Carlito syrichta]|uniref:Radial spoke head protein 9 homolog n=1 Tax=Carlito syrichta TaxID=1868482 RepID=A0A1U7UTN6_CARSF|nr:radial spoke head protein 9 homolog [Carlito syrichta]